MNTSKNNPVDRARMEALKAQLHRIPELQPIAAEARKVELERGRRRVKRHSVLALALSVASAAAVALVLLWNTSAGVSGGEDLAVDETAELVAALYDCGYIDTYSLMEWTSGMELDSVLVVSLDPEDYFDYFEPSTTYYY